MYQISEIAEMSDANKSERCQLVTSPMFVLHALHGSNDPNSFVRTLNELMPTYVVLYDADMSSVRQLEVCPCPRWISCCLQS